MQPEIRTISTSALMKRFAPYFKKYLPMLILDLFCAALTTVCDVALPLIVRNITQLAVDGAAALTVAYVVKIGLFYLALRLVDAAANYYMTAQGHIMGSYIERDMRLDLFKHLQSLGFAYYSNAKIGQIMARITSDLFEVTEFAHHCPEEFFIAGIKITVSFGVLFSINPTLTLIIFGSLPIMFVITLVFRKRFRGTFQERRHQLGEINAQVEDSLLGIRVVKS
ncbi:MAG TPA: ABC transporter ATP-binding protein, partial [Candidatus Limiplasma sp.]|nr:ABC transporter ATP-binding protein [Candidatus Limiplasma sp.]